MARYYRVSRGGFAEIPARTTPPPCALAGHVVGKEGYIEQIKLVNATAADLYRDMHFDQIKGFVKAAAALEM